MALAGAVGLVVFGAELVQDHWRAWRRRNRVAYERFGAERFIHETRRQAIRELLAAAHEVRMQAREDVIEGTAVEVER